MMINLNILGKKLIVHKYFRSHRREFYWSPLAKGSIINYDGKITKVRTSEVS